MIPFISPELVPAKPVTRFAPSPTGYLHLGHVVNALLVWGIARARGGTVLLRMEDHDRQRSRPDYALAILEDLAWLGLEADTAPVFQSHRAGLYEEQLAILRSRAHVYACSCSRRDLTRQAEVPTGTEPRYPGTCRQRGLEWKPGASLRVELDDGVVEFSDAARGQHQQRPGNQCGDIALKDRLNNWTYQYAVTVDDYLQRVNLVIRGEDLLASTGRQIKLARLLGRSEPAIFLHHPLILKPGGEKLSKSSGDTGIRELRAQGLAPEAVLGRAAFLGGLVNEEQPLSIGAYAENLGQVLA